MQQVTVGPNYEIVIPEEIRKKMKGFVPGAKVIVYAENNNRLSIKLVNEL